MKANITYLFYMAALLLVGCSQDDESVVETPNAKPLTFTITDGGYSTGGSGGTRATEDGYTTKFTEGDACGLYIVRKGELKAENVKLTAKEENGNIVWTPELSEGATLTGEATDSYYLYYPYKDDKYMTDKVDLSGITAAIFFDQLCSKWEVKDNQSNYDDYTASDLMMGEGTAKEENSTISLTFNMSHCMALAVIEMPKTVYKFTNNGISPYTTSTPVKFINVSPWQKSPGTYRYIYKPNDPNTVISGNYYKNGKGRYFEISQSNLSTNGGAGKIFYVDRNSNEEISDYTLQVGDYLMKDGNLVGKDEPLSESQKADVAAIVFWAGDATAKDKTLKADHSGCTHGLAVAVKGDEETQWQNSSVSVQEWLNANRSGVYLNVQTEGIGLQHQVNNIQGYNNTKAIEDYNNANADSKVLAVEKIVAYRTSNPAPANSSNWYLPSAKELSIICGKDVTVNIWGKGKEVGTDNRVVINMSLQNVDGATQLGTANLYYYLSSTEYDGTRVVYVKFFDGFVMNDVKSYSNYVRPVLAF